MKVISGGQSGVDRAALDAAIAAKLPCGGWCPKGRRAEDGRIDSKYPLVETGSSNYLHRTRLNVEDSDATLILTRGVVSGGTAYTATYARSLNKPSILVNLDEETDCNNVLRWLEIENIKTLNIAGPRESKNPGTHAQAEKFLQELFNSLAC